MIKLMVLHHHHGTSYYDVSNDEIKSKSLLAAFNFMDKDYGSYSDIEERVEDVKTWKEELEELKEMKKNGKIPKALHMDMAELDAKITDVENDIENAGDEIQLYNHCVSGNVEAIEKFMRQRSDEGAESEDLEFVDVEEV